MALVRAHMTMLPRLQAEEAMDLAQATALGSGSLKPADARRIAHALQRQARPPGSRRRPPAPADPRALAMMGIAVVPEAGPSGPAAGADGSRHTNPPVGAGDRTGLSDG